MLCQEIQNIMSLAIALKIKDLLSPNKMIWMVCPACSSMGYQLHSPVFVIDTAHLVPCILDYKYFLPSLLHLFLLHVYTIAWFQNIAEFFRCLMSTLHHHCIYPEASFLSTYLTVPGRSFPRGLDYISQLDTDCQFCNFSKTKIIRGSGKI